MAAIVASQTAQPVEPDGNRLIESDDLAVVLNRLRAEAELLGFGMSCDDLTGSLLRSLAASKPGGRILELGTGVGIGSAWLLDGMDRNARLSTVDIEATLTDVAARHLGSDARISIHTQDAAEFLSQRHGQYFDLIFADTWAGKLERPELALDLLAPGGVYVADDMRAIHVPPDDLPGVPAERLVRIPGQWHGLLTLIEQREDLRTSALDWSSGVLICTRRSN